MDEQPSVNTAESLVVSLLVNFALSSLAASLLGICFVISTIFILL